MCVYTYVLLLENNDDLRYQKLGSYSLRALNNYHPMPLIYCSCKCGFRLTSLNVLCPPRYLNIVLSLTESLKGIAYES